MKLPDYPAPEHADEFYRRELAKWAEANHVDALDYWPDTPAVCQLNDLNNLLTRDRKVRRAAGIQTDPKALLLGVHEFENLHAVAWHGQHPGGLFPEPPHLKGRAKQRWLDAPSQITYFGLTVYPLKTFSCFRML